MAAIRCLIMGFSLSILTATTAASPSPHLPLTNRQSPPLTLSVDLATRHQTIDGFGFSEAFQRANGIKTLPEPQRSEVIDLLFNATTGAGFTILRNGIGSSPNSTLDWMNTILPVGPRSPNDEPEYVWDEDDSGQLWVSAQALKYGVKTFYANAWSAPGFMKTNNMDSNGGFLCGTPSTPECPTADWRKPYAEYLAHLIHLYANHSIPITHLGFLNEPDLTTTYASMRMDGPQAADFIKVLSPVLAAQNLSHVQIACCEATGWEVAKEYTMAIEADEEARDAMGVYTGHEYTGRIDSTQPTTSGKKVWETEISDLGGAWSTAWYQSGNQGDGFHWANRIYTGLTTGNVSAYLWWEGTQDRATNNNNNEKLILVDEGKYEVSKRLWAFAQFSRTVRPGATRVQVGDGGNGDLRVTAFENGEDGGETVAVNVINHGTETAEFTIEGVAARGARAWVTDNASDMVEEVVMVGEDGVVNGVEVPGRGMVSVVIEQIGGEEEEVLPPVRCTKKV